ncbi:MAG TPA: MFS transporter [Gaiellaceae bacterium]|nr:MFS transporter [Gaiellaceae bacterium]
MPSARATGLTLSLCLAASQAAVLVLTPVLAVVAADLEVSTATAGQLRTASGLAAGATALLAGLLASRVGLRELLAVGLGLLAVGSCGSAAAPTFAVLLAAQAVIGLGIGLTYSAGVAAVADWSRPVDRSRVLAVALLGPPLAWVFGMPLAGLVGDASWRLVWVVVPLASALAALGALALRPSTRPASLRADLRSVLGHPGVLRWSLGELLAFSAWAGALVFVGAFFVESYGVSVAATGALLGAGALVYVPGNLLFRRWVDRHARRLLVGLALAAAALVVALNAIRHDRWSSLALFAALSFVAGGRTLAGSARGLDLAPELRLGVTGVRTAAIQLGYFLGAAVGGAALAAGGYGALGGAFAVLFAGAALTHVWPPAGDEAAVPDICR